jgi:hypothetical protein
MFALLHAILVANLPSKSSDLSAVKKSIHCVFYLMKMSHRQYIPISLFLNFNRIVRYVSFSPTGDYLTYCCDNGKLYVWSITQAKSEDVN